MFVWLEVLGNFWSNGKGMLIMIIPGLESRRWATLRMRSGIILVLCLGRQEPEGGVVLGLHLDYHRLYDFLPFMYFIYLKVNIILLWIC
jgi:hypothetical protein